MSTSGLGDSGRLRDFRGDRNPRETWLCAHGQHKERVLCTDSGFPPRSAMEEQDRSILTGQRPLELGRGGCPPSSSHKS